MQTFARWGGIASRPTRALFILVGAASAFAGPFHDALDDIDANALPKAREKLERLVRDGPDGPYALAANIYLASHRLRRFDDEAMDYLALHDKIRLDLEKLGTAAESLHTPARSRAPGLAALAEVLVDAGPAGAGRAVRLFEESSRVYATLPLDDVIRREWGRCLFVEAMRWLSWVRMRHELPGRTDASPPDPAARSVAALMRLLALQPPPSLRVKALLLLGHAHKSSGREREHLEKAIEAYQKVVEDYPRSKEAPRALHSLGEAYERLGETQKALAAYRRRNTDHPRDEFDVTGGRIEELTKPQLRLYSPGQQAPGLVPHVRLSARNLGSVSMEAHDLDLLAAARRGIDLGRTVDALPRGRRVAAWTHRIQDTGKHIPYEADVALPIDAPGSYLVTARAGGSTATAQCTVSRLALIAKTSAARRLVFVADRTTGAPIGDATVVLAAASKDGRYRYLEEERTGPDGIAAFAKTLPPDLATAFQVVAGTGRHVAYVDGWIGTSGGEPPPMKVYAYTDRPLYRPGQTVHFKAVLRAQHASGYELPSLPAVDVVVSGPRGGRPIARVRRSLSPIGTIACDFALPRDVVTGPCQVQLELGDPSQVEHLHTLFHVVDHPPPDMHVELLPTRSFIRPGQPLRVDVHVTGRTGEAPARGTVRWRMIRPRPDSYWAFASRRGRMEDPSETAEDAKAIERWERSGTAELDSGGRCTIEATADPLWEDCGIQVRVDVLAEGGATAGASTVVDVARAGVSIWLDPEVFEAQPGERIGIEVMSVDANGKPIPLTGRVRVRERGTGGRGPRPMPGQPTASVSPSAVSSPAPAAFTTNEEGRGAFEWVAPKPGLFDLDFEASDSAGTPVGRTCTVVAKGAVVTPRAVPSRPWKPVSDRSRYEPGDTATLTIEGPSEGGQALLTIEGGTILFEQVVDGGRGPVHLKLPIGEEHVPGVDLTLSAVRDGKVRRVTRRILVAPTRKILKVSIASERTTYAPGDPVKFSLGVTDWRGRPVDAEVSLAVVDAASSFAATEALPNAREHFHGGPWRNAVASRQSVEEDAPRGSDVAYLRAGAPTRTSLGEVVARGSAAPETASWAPSIRTGAAGTASVTVLMPETLTAWTATAFAVTTSTAVGEGRLRVETRKDLSVTFVAPQFITQGDEMVLRLVAESRLPRPAIVDLRLKAMGLEVVGTPPGKIVAQPGSPASSTVRIRARQPGSGLLLVHAQSDVASDTFQQAIDVVPHTVDATAAAAGEVRDRAVLRLELPPDASLSPRRLTIALGPPASPIALDRIPGISAFPSRGSHDLLTSVLGAWAAIRACGALGALPGHPYDDFEACLRSGLEELQRLQRADGGWSWSRDDADVMSSALIVETLARLCAAGVRVEPAMVERGRVFLLGRLRDEKSPEARSLALLAVMYLPCPAGNRSRQAHGAPPLFPPWGLDAEASGRLRSWLTEAYSGRESLQPGALGALTLALWTAGRATEARTCLSLLDGLAQTGDAEDGSYLGKTREYSGRSSDPVAATAMALRAHDAMAPDAAIVPRFTRWLERHHLRPESGSPVDVAAAAFALVEHHRRPWDAASIPRVAIAVNGRSLGEAAVPAAGRGRPGAMVTVPAELVVEGVNTVELRAAGLPVDYVALLDSAVETERAPAVDHGIAVERRYVLSADVATATGTGAPAAPSPAEPRPTVVVRAGERFDVELAITSPVERAPVLVEDPRPAGCEPVHASGSEAWDPQTATRAGVDPRKQRTILTIARVPGGRVLFRYGLRAVTPGRYHVLAPVARATYAPAVRARGSEDILVVQP